MQEENNYHKKATFAKVYHQWEMQHVIATTSCEPECILHFSTWTVLLGSDQINPLFSFSSVYTVCCLIQLGTCHTTTASVYELQPLKQSSRPCNAIVCQTNLSFSRYYHSHMYMQEKQKFHKNNCTCTVSSLFMAQKFAFLILWNHERDGKSLIWKLPWQEPESTRRAQSKLAFHYTWIHYIHFFLLWERWVKRIKLFFLK